MKLYIPEIGDKLKLAEDWHFKLHAERRNVDLGALFGYYYMYGSDWVNENILPQMRPQDFEVRYPDRSLELSHSEYNAECKRTEEACPEYNKYWDEYKTHHDKSRSIGKSTIDVVIPAGTVLKVDRIYIRKGALDYSSVTFYATGLGTVVVTPSYSWEKKKKKSSLRFWAKLCDCNNIVFEKVIDK